MGRYQDSYGNLPVKELAQNTTRTEMVRVHNKLDAGQLKRAIVGEVLVHATTAPMRGTVLVTHLNTDIPIVVNIATIVGASSVVQRVVIRLTIIGFTLTVKEKGM